MAKIVGVTLLVLSLGLYGAFYYFSSPKSDKKIRKLFKKTKVVPIISYEEFRGFRYRKLSIQKDTILPTLVFVHGTIGSSTDFIAYMKDSLLRSKANMISYDRVGYNYKDKNAVQESIAFEADLLEDLIQDLDTKKTVLVGYSYGGPIALATKNNYKRIVLLAPAAYSKVEPMPWMVNLYKWKATRWLVPPVWKQAGKEKLSHQEDLQKFENDWKKNTSKIVSIHGDADWIVPYANSEFLKTQFSKEQFQLVTIKEVGHSLVWSHFELIKKELLNQLG